MCALLKSGGWRWTLDARGRDGTGQGGGRMGSWKPSEEGRLGQEGRGFTSSNIYWILGFICLHEFLRTCASNVAGTGPVWLSRLADKPPPGQMFLCPEAKEASGNQNSPLLDAVDTMSLTPGQLGRIGLFEFRKLHAKPRTENFLFNSYQCLCPTFSLCKMSKVANGVK